VRKPRVGMGRQHTGNNAALISRGGPHPLVLVS
jgi:hypothetical protein